MKKFIALLLVLMIIVSAIPANAFGAGVADSSVSVLSVAGVEVTMAAVRSGNHVAPTPA